MFIPIGEDDAGRCYYVALYRPGCLAALPWGDDSFDCVVFLCDTHLGRGTREELSRDLVQANVDWVQVAGSGAEVLHDSIDRTSVAVGRQLAVGDGSPMTSWHEEAQAAEEMAEVAALCFGSQDRVLILVLGQEQDLQTSVVAMKNRRARRYS